jgi:hypothetical protein
VLKKIVITALLILPVQLLAQNPFYYHTIRTNSLGASFGRTWKAQYTYQLSRRGQLKVVGNYVLDEYDQGNNRIRADIYNVNLQMQQNVFFYDRFFAHLSFGVGGYQLDARDKIDIKHRERKFTFTGGVQLEFYLMRNSIALIGDYDALWMPFSKIYNVLHVPTIGLGFFF